MSLWMGAQPLRTRAGEGRACWSRAWALQSAALCGGPALRGAGLAGARSWAPGLGEGLTALVVKVVHSSLRGVVKSTGLVYVGAGPREQQ